MLRGSADYVGGRKQSCQGGGIDGVRGVISGVMRVLASWAVKQGIVEVLGVI